MSSRTSFIREIFPPLRSTVIQECDPTLASGTRDSCKVWNMFMLNGILYATHFKWSVAFDWNTRLVLTIKPVHDRIPKPTWSTEDPHQSLYMPNTVFKLPSGTHFLILSIPWIPDKTQPKLKNYRDNMHVFPAKSKQLPWCIFISFHAVFYL